MVLAVVMISAILTCGCVPLFIGAAAGVGGYAWFNGAMEKDFAVPLAKLHGATVKGLKHMGVKIDENESDKHIAKIKAHFADDEKVGIVITSVTERSSSIKIRVGLMGDKMRSEMILNAAKNYF